MENCLWLCEAVENNPANDSIFRGQWKTSNEMISAIGYFMLFYNLRHFRMQWNYLDHYIQFQHRIILIKCLLSSENGPYGA